jgi:hypothetical protein
MIRIDEIYSITFWPWLQRHRPCMRMFYFWPFGHSDRSSICNYGGSDEFVNKHTSIVLTNQHLIDNNYTLFFDQEPIDLDRHRASFDRVKYDLNPEISIVWEAHQYIRDSEWRSTNLIPPQTGILVTSEKDSDTVDQVCKEYNWKKLYYFFHGWAALDWYRGYDCSYVMPAPENRVITKTFIMPNRIIAGQRQHRLIMLYHIFKYNMQNNHISCPSVCPAENISIEDAVKDLFNKYSDIKEVFNTQQFPMEFNGESGAPMHSYQLSLFEECAESLLYLVTETVATGRRLHLTEKTFKPICLRMPFIIVGTCGSLKYLRSYGFKTFGHLWDESYDDEIHDDQRIEKIAFTLKAMDILPPDEKQRLFDMAQEICEYNYNHFYNGDFENILKQELDGMLNELANF